MTKPKSWRGIVLLPVISKVVERVVAGRLQLRALEKGGISRSIYAYLPGSDAELLLTNRVEWIRRQQMRNKRCVMLLVDMSDAFCTPICVIVTL